MARASQRTYKLGQRRADLQRNPETYSKHRAAWCSIFAGQFVIMVNNDTKTVTGPDISILVHQANRKYPSVINLTGSTVEELDALQDLFNSAFEWARPIAELRDKEARDAFEQGDDSHARYYRQLPKLVYRKRPESEHGEGVQHGSEDVSPLAGSPDDQHDGAGVGGDEVAERDSGAGSAQDDWPTPNQPPSIQ